MSNELVSSKYTFACDPEHCDCLIELTSSDGFGFPSGVVEITCPCGRKPTLLSVQHATIQPTNERNNMETTTEVPTTYNANVLVTYKDIIDGVATYPTVKVNDLEYKLERIKNLEDFLSRSQGTIRQIIDKLTVQEWYNPNTDKDEVLRELCEILDHEPKQEIRITGTMTFELRYDCPLDEVEDFDARYFAQDTLTLDAYNGDVIVESFDVEDADIEF
jgi:hypothetical protein